MVLFLIRAYDWAFGCCVAYSLRELLQLWYLCQLYVNFMITITYILKLGAETIQIQIVCFNLQRPNVRKKWDQDMFLSNNFFVCIILYGPSRIISKVLKQWVSQRSNVLFTFGKNVVHKTWLCLHIVCYWVEFSKYLYTAQGYSSFPINLRVCCECAL